MLEKQYWMNYATELMTEWKQCRDEGRDVAGLEEACREISALAGISDCRELAVKLREQLVNAPVAENYPYEEPSGLAEIRAALPEKRRNLSNTLSDAALSDKLAGAWVGRISGCLLGKPLEGVMRDVITPLLKGTGNYPMTRYVEKRDFTAEIKELLGDRVGACWADTLDGMAPIDDDTNYTVLALKLVEEYGKDFRPNDVLEAWLNWVPMFATCTAERVAYRNAATGLCAPETATWCNPYREWIGAQIRGDFFGYINPGDPARAAEMVWRDASISHIRNGIYGEMYAAALIAAAAVCDDMMTVIEAALDEIPAKCRLRRDIDQVIAWHAEGMDVLDVMDEIHRLYDEHDQHDWCHTNSNAMIVTMALLYGGGDFAKTIGYAVMTGFDTDCNGATAGSVVGIMLGEGKIPDYWTSFYNRKLNTSISGYNVVTIDELAAKTLELIKK